MRSGGPGCAEPAHLHYGNNLRLALCAGRGNAFTSAGTSSGTSSERVSSTNAQSNLIFFLWWRWASRQRTPLCCTSHWEWWVRWTRDTSVAQRTPFPRSQALPRPFACALAPSTHASPAALSHRARLPLPSRVPIPRFSICLSSAGRRLSPGTPAKLLVKLEDRNKGLESGKRVGSEKNTASDASESDRGRCTLRKQGQLLIQDQEEDRRLRLYPQPDLSYRLLL